MKEAKKREEGMVVISLSFVFSLSFRSFFLAVFPGAFVSGVLPIVNQKVQTGFKKVVNPRGGKIARFTQHTLFLSLALARSNSVVVPFTAATAAARASTIYRGEGRRVGKHGENASKRKQPQNQVLSETPPLT
jgi:hypothetical protein